MAKINTNSNNVNVRKPFLLMPRTHVYLRASRTAGWSQRHQRRFPSVLQPGLCNGPRRWLLQDSSKFVLAHVRFYGASPPTFRASYSCVCSSYETVIAVNRQPVHLLCVLVCALRIKSLLLPVDILHIQCPCQPILNPREIQALRAQTFCLSIIPFIILALYFLFSPSLSYHIQTQLRSRVTTV